MYRFLAIMMLFLPGFAFSQARLSYQKADSLSYQYYLKGEWKKLIELSKQAGKLNIESKLIDQRAGYAYFVTEDYYASAKEYEKAYKFDQSDDVSREFLYYSNLMAGSINTRYYAGKLSYNSVYKLGIKRYNPVESFDSEFNLKTNQSATRSSQIYYRFGINTDIGYRISLYQAYSYYQQTISNVLTQQPEYLAILKFTLSPIWHLKTAYHHLFSNVGNVNYPENLGFIALNSQLGRYSFEANGSFLKSSTGNTIQTGLQAGYHLPGRSGIYFNGALSGIFDATSNRLIFAGTSGFRCLRNLWAEGNVTLGNLKNYNTFNSLYIFNSVDPSVFRTGFTLAWFLGKHLSIVGNYTFDQQEITNNTTNKYYYQHSYSGGLKWKL